MWVEISSTLPVPFSANDALSIGRIACVTADYNKLLPSGRDVSDTLPVLELTERQCQKRKLAEKHFTPPLQTELRLQLI